jgi:hypothetical protein
VAAAYRYVRPQALATAQIVLFCAATIRGGDYIVRDYISAARATWTLTIVEESGPLWLWGALFITAGVIGIAGELWCRYINRRAAPTVPWMCHVVLFALYAVVAFAQVPPIIAAGWGFSACTECLVVGIGHLVFVLQEHRRVPR